MSQPWPHPKTGVFWFRRAVPRDLVPLVKKREELQSLRTKDPAEARVRHSRIAAEVETRWANLRTGVKSLTEREAHSLAAQIHDRWIQWHADEPSQQFTWVPRLYRNLWRPSASTEPVLNDGVPSMNMDVLVLKSTRRFCFIQADNCLEFHGLTVTDESRLKLAKAIAVAFQRASKTLVELSEGLVTPDQVPALNEQTSGSAGGLNRELAPLVGGKTVPAPALTALSLTGLFEAWWREALAAGRKPSTHESYLGTVKSLIAFLKHDDATRVTALDVVAFKDHRLSTPSPRTGRIPSPKTVKDSDLSALKTLFGWAVMNHKLSANPAAGLTIKVGRKAQIRPKGFIEEEAHAILSAALAYKQGPKESDVTAAAKRWIPWLCAFSGARVGEIAQLRRQDVRQEGECWVIRVTPEAGTVKTNQARDVVLHSQLIELGFPTFVMSSSAGPLFLKPGKDGDVLGPLEDYLTVSESSFAPSCRTRTCCRITVGVIYSRPCASMRRSKPEFTTPFRDMPVGR